jgi:hypothetical protein
MKQFILASLSLFIGISLFSQEIKINQKVFDTASKHDIMIGICTLAGISDTTFISVYKEEYKVYNPDKDVIDQINTLLDGIKVTIVMGTWCSDSREQVPRFFKVLSLTETYVPDPAIICVDRNKIAGNFSLEGMDVLKVPTFIIYHNGRELGRIIETPKTTMEHDFLELLNKKL